jgi:hypothetical protein
MAEASLRRIVTVDRKNPDDSCPERGENISL